jgi:hypothetical protein
MYGGELSGPRNNNAPRGTGTRLLEDYTMKRGMVFGSIIVAAMLAFELFNYSTTDFALANLLGDLKFMGLRWAMILAIAFCGMDFAGIARLFTPEKGRSEHVEVWYLLAAWFLAATMNAMLTWWGVSLALLQHQSLGNEILSRATLLAVVPVFVAIMVWLIRILMIGTLSMAGERLFSFGQTEEAALPAQPEPEPEPAPLPVAAGLHLPTAVWRGSTGPLRSEPLPSQPTRPEPAILQPRPAPAARTIGAANEGEPAERRSPTVAERHGYGRTQQQPTRPVVQPPLPGQPVRPAPKPVTPPLNERPVPAQRPMLARATETPSNGNGNGHSNGNGNGNGNGNSHGPNPSRSFDPDLDD